MLGDLSAALKAARIHRVSLEWLQVPTDRWDGQQVEIPLENLRGSQTSGGAFLRAEAAGVFSVLLEPSSWLFQEGEFLQTGNW